MGRVGRLVRPRRAKGARPVAVPAVVVVPLFAVSVAGVSVRLASGRPATSTGGRVGATAGPFRGPTATLTGVSPVGRDVTATRGGSRGGVVRYESVSRRGTEGPGATRDGVSRASRPGRAAPPRNFSQEELPLRKKGKPRPVAGASPAGVGRDVTASSARPHKNGRGPRAAVPGARPGILGRAPGGRLVSGRRRPTLAIRPRSTAGAGG